jgi:hypothetical protein
LHPGGDNHASRLAAATVSPPFHAPARSRFRCARHGCP